MIITWYGQSCFKIQSGDTAVVIDPFAKKIGLTPPNIQADVVFVTHEHFDHNNIKAIKGDYFLINGPGEYEIKGVKARGIASYHDDEKGAKRGLNTLYLIEFEEIRILHMGDFGQSALNDKQFEAVGRVDIAMIPVGGFFTMDAKQAVGIVNVLTPKIAIPMHYKIPKLAISQLTGVDTFLKELGEEDIKAEEKLVVKQKDLGGEDERTRVVVLKI